MRLKYLIFPLLLLFFATAACSDNDEPDYPDLNDMTGRWRCVATLAADGSASMPWILEETYFTFGPGNAVSTEGVYGFLSGTIVQDRSILTCTFSDGSQLRIRIQSVSADNAQVSITDIFGAKTVILSRIHST